MRTLSLISDTASPCGVEHFQRRLSLCLGVDQLGAHTTCAVVGQPGEMKVLARHLRDVDAVIIGLPVVAWKRRLVAPLRAMLVARRMGKEVFAVVHEWADLDWKRRALFRMYLPAATRLLFSSPVVHAQFDADPIAAICTRHRGLMPIPPNIEAPAVLPLTPVARELAALRASGKLLVGAFGSIYPRKQPGALLEIVAELKRRGHPVHAVFVGDFVRDATVDVAALFAREVERLGLRDDVMVTGFVAQSDDVFAALGPLDAIVYRFAEGLTSRRSSVLAGVLSGRPVIVNAPADPREFDHHPAYRAALAAGAITLVAMDAPTSMFADAILDRATPGSIDPRAVFQSAWAASAAATRSMSQPRHEHSASALG